MAKCSGRIGHVYRTAKFRLDHLPSSKWAAGGKIVEDIFRRVTPLHYDDVPFAYDESDMRARSPISVFDGHACVLDPSRGLRVETWGNSIRRLGSKPRKNWWNLIFNARWFVQRKEERDREKHVAKKYAWYAIRIHPVSLHRNIDVRHPRIMSQATLLHYANFHSSYQTIKRYSKSASARLIFSSELDTCLSLATRSS